MRRSWNIAHMDMNYISGVLPCHNTGSLIVKYILVLTRCAAEFYDDNISFFFTGNMLYTRRDFIRYMRYRFYIFPVILKPSLPLYDCLINFTHRDKVTGTHIFV